MNNPIADFTCGMLLVQGILLALVAREKTGRGQTVTASLLDGMIFSQLQEAAQWLNTGMTLNWGHLPMGGPYQTKDGTIGIVGAFRPNPLRDLCGVFEIEDLSATDPRFGPGEGDNFAHAAELEAILAENFKKQTTAEWLERLEKPSTSCARGCCLSRRRSTIPQVRHNNMVIEIDHPQGKIKVVGNAGQAGRNAGDRAPRAAASRGAQRRDPGVARRDGGLGSMTRPRRRRRHLPRDARGAPAASRPVIGSPALEPRQALRLATSGGARLLVKADRLAGWCRVRRRPPAGRPGPDDLPWTAPEVDPRELLVLRAQARTCGRSSSRAGW